MIGFVLGQGAGGAGTLQSEIEKDWGKELNKLPLIK